MEATRIAASDLACRRGERVLFAGLSLSLEAGQACQVTGPNGAGKSSLIRILAGLLRPVAGTVERCGTMALLDQHVPLDEHLPLGRALAFWQRLDTAGSQALELLGMADLTEVPVRYLSTGQRKRAVLACLLGQQASIWLLDEPLNGLDREAAALVEGLIAEKRAAGGVVVVASHQLIELPEAQVIALQDYPA